MKNIMPPINTPDNAFHDGNPATGEQGTIVPGAWLNNVQSGVISIQQELLSVLTKAGIEIDETKQDQLVTAITKLITQGIPELPSASLAQKGIVQLSSATNSDSETLAATSKAVKTANDAALKIVNNLSEIAAAGPGAVLAAITNLNLLTTVNRANGSLQSASNLSEINLSGPAAMAAAVANLGLTEAAAAVANALKKSANLSDVANPAAALKNIGGFAVRGPLDSKNLNLIGNTDEIGVWYQITDAVTENNNYPVRASGTLLVTPSAYGCQQEYTSYSGLKFVRGLSAAWNGSGPWQQWQQISAQQPKAVTTSDYIRIPDVPGGLIIQWFAGNTSMGEASMGPLSFPIAFPSACIFSSVSTLGNGTGACDQMFQVTSTNRNSITLFSQVFGSGSVPGTAIPLILVIGY